MIGTAIRIAIAVTGDFISSVINEFSRVTDDGEFRVTDDNVERIID